MYSLEKLIKYPYFESVLRANGLTDILDPLTGLLQRPYIIGFAQHLIENNIPFSFGMLDLDNFKFINDTYGHSAGDGVLSTVAHELIDSLDGIGLAGRFGGDEYLFINLRDLEYSDKKHFFEKVYTSSRVLRRNVELPHCKPFITGTIGCATFPDDASDYEELFGMVDKTLYRGKSKGRNCYIIYVEEKHRNLEIQNLAGHGLFTTLHNIDEQFQIAKGLREKLKLTFKTLKEDLRVSDLYYVGHDGMIRSVNDAAFEADAGDIGRLMSVDLYSTNKMDYIKDISPRLSAALKQREIETVIAVKVSTKEETYGYLLCAEPRSLRIWQEDESAVLYFLACLTAAYILRTGELLG